MVLKYATGSASRPRPPGAGTAGNQSALSFNPAGIPGYTVSCRRPAAKLQTRRRPGS